MRLEEFQKICEEKAQLRAAWHALVIIALEIAIEELPIALKKYHGHAPTAN